MASIASISGSVRYVSSLSLPACAHRRTLARCRKVGVFVRRQCSIAAATASQTSSSSPSARKYASCGRVENDSRIQFSGVGTEIPMPLSSHTHRIDIGRPRFFA